MKNIIALISKLEQTTSILDKKNLLKEYDCPEVRQFFIYALGKKRYGLRMSSPDVWGNKECSFDDMCLVLDTLSERKITGNKAVEYTEMFVKNLSKESQNIFLKMLNKRVGCGVSIQIVNEMYGNIVDSGAYIMKAMSYSQKNMRAITYPAISQRKCDGERCLAFVKDGSLISSSGKSYYNLTGLEEEISLIDKDVVLDGELLVVDENGNVLPRKIGNGILNKSLHNTISQEESERVRYVIWDCINYNEYMTGGAKGGTIDYSVRYQMGRELVKGLKRISFVETKIVNNFNEAFEHFKEMVSRGEEGTILKNCASSWEGKRSKNCIKFKVVIQTTMRITGYIEGKEKYTGMLGAIMCESNDGLVKVKVGSGFTDSDRKTLWEQRKNLIGKYIEIESNALISTEQGNYSLFLPRYVEIREDKNVADDFDMIKSLSDGSELLKK